LSAHDRKEPECSVLYRVVFGHMARSQIKRTGEQGADLALAGLILGWAAVILGIVLIIGLAMGGMHGIMPAH